MDVPLVELPKFQSTRPVKDATRGRDQRLRMLQRFNPRVP